jgi:uncharacterized protein (DUF2147 family)
MHRFLPFVALLLLAAAPPEAGRWRTQDGSSVIGIDACAQAIVCGRIIGVSLDHPTDPPPRDKWGGLQCNETIIKMTTREDNGRLDGTILDPRSGRLWRAQIWRDGADLRLRGYIGLPLFGATQVWTPYAGPLGPNCAYTR